MSKYKREDTKFKAKLAKRFPKHDDKIVTATIDENGDVLFLATHENDAVFLNHGTVVTRRASHVEPANAWLRPLFHVLRFFAGNKDRVAAWTRTWNCEWRINTRPVGGPILTWGDVWKAKGHVTLSPWLDTLSQYNQTAIFTGRQKAIDAEIVYLNKFFLEGC